MTGGNKAFWTGPKPYLYMLTDLLNAVYSCEHHCFTSLLGKHSSLRNDLPLPRHFCSFLHAIALPLACWPCLSHLCLLTCWAQSLDSDCNFLQGFCGKAFDVPVRASKDDEPEIIFGNCTGIPGDSQVPFAASCGVLLVLRKLNILLIALLCTPHNCFDLACCACSRKTLWRSNDPG